jgi:uncharacterized tellurite resistance protein B-like protein
MQMANSFGECALTPDASSKAERNDTVAAMEPDGGPVSVSGPLEVTESSSRARFELRELLEQFERQRNLDWSVPEAFVCLLLSAAVADGNCSPEERVEIESLSRRSRALKSVSPAQLAKANAVVRQRLDGHPDGLREACESLPEDMRLSLFAHCVDIVLSDGLLVPSEIDFLSRIMNFMGINPSEGRRVMEVLLIKNRF